MARNVLEKAPFSYLASLKFTVVLLLVLAFGSLLGTLFPQGLSEHELTSRYTPETLRWVSFFSLHDLYHSGWFRFLMALLAANIIVCTLQRLPKTLNLLRRKESALNPERLTKFSLRQQWSLAADPGAQREAVREMLRRSFSSFTELETSPGAFAAVAEKGRWSVLMIYVVHMSILVILLGAFIGSLFGFRGMMNIPEGSASDVVHLFGRQEAVRLPFQVRCDDFDISFYETGLPKEYRSDLTILLDGREVKRRSIRVNDPLTHDGVTFYQSSYGAFLEEAEVELRRDAGDPVRLRLPYRQPVALPGSNLRIQVMDFLENFSQFGPALGIVVWSEDREPEGSWILADRPDFHGNRVGDYRIRVLEIKKAHYTGLQVKKDPGVWIVIGGFVLLLVGLTATFYTSHRKIWLWMGPAEAGGKVLVAGRSSKNSLAFEQEFHHFCERLRSAAEAA
jgi:cytochrome c biogenesis protein